MDKSLTPQAVEHCHQLLLWLIPQLDKFPRDRRFTLGERLETRLLHVLELLVAATYTTEKTHLLKQANQELEVIRHLWRLCHELQIINTRRYEYGSNLLLALGKQVGGWFKASRS
ncbi:MAG: diversity-generating retroelement protein Avd [Thiothrix sp.]|nr:MAG: diversity-generating retroelement protein Avd [Thiothrix sp.]